jgi:hypothetical protein
VFGILKLTPVYLLGTFGRDISEIGKEIEG